jgi:hypothetical protein
MEPVKQDNNRDEQGRFKEGSSGNPNGRPKKGHAITDVIRQMMDEKPEIKKALATKLFELALGGDLAAIRELMDRLEGRALQGLDLTTDGEALDGLVIVTNGSSTK